MGFHSENVIKITHYFALKISRMYILNIIDFLSLECIRNLGFGLVLVALNTRCYRDKLLKFFLL